MLSSGNMKEVWDLKKVTLSLRYEFVWMMPNAFYYNIDHGLLCLVPKALLPYLFSIFLSVSERGDRSYHWVLDASAAVGFGQGWRLAVCLVHLFPFLQQLLVWP